MLNYMTGPFVCLTAQQSHDVRCCCFATRHWYLVRRCYDVDCVCVWLPPLHVAPRFKRQCAGAGAGVRMRESRLRVHVRVRETGVRERVWLAWPGTRVRSLVQVPSTVPSTLTQVARCAPHLEQYFNAFYYAPHVLVIAVLVLMPGKPKKPKADKKEEKKAE